MTGPPPVHLLPLGDAALSDRVLGDLAGRLAHLLGSTVDVVPPIRLHHLPPSVAHDRIADPASRRLCSNHLVDALIGREGGAPGKSAFWTLAVTAHDLYAPDRHFVFGEATQGGRWAVVSGARFGLPAKGSPRLLERLLKESLHELGHLASLDHCDDDGCPMSIARRVADVDRKKTTFCEGCARRIFSGNRP